MGIQSYTCRGQRLASLAVAYHFGKKRFRGDICGESVTGKWQLGGDTERAAMVDDDDVRIGSAMADNRASTFAGDVGEIAL